MALDFGTTAQDYYVDHGTLGSLNPTAGTIAMWVKITGIQDGMRLVSKWASSSNFGFNIAGSGFPADFSIFLQGSTWANRLQAISSTTPIATDTWVFLATRWDTSGVDADQELFYGDLDATVAEVATYSYQAVGASPKNPSANPLQIGGIAAQSWAYTGSIAAIMGMWTSRLTIGELRTQQRALFPVADHANCVLFCNYGWNGTGTQPDWSGSGNDGTVTGASVSNHVPLGLPFQSSAASAQVVAPPQGMLTYPGMSGGMSQLTGGING